MSPKTYAYQGSELDLFQHAGTWKRYYAARLQPYIKGDVLEVGAGIGGTSRVLCTDRPTSWTCLEPDPLLVKRLEAALAAQALPVRSRVVCGSTDSLGPSEQFDTLLYIDVLEHIEDDRGELARAALHVRPGGHVIVLSPAHNYLFSPFDRAIGHYRRYTKGTLVRTAPADLALVRAFYLDSVGMLLSLANRMFLRSEYPSLSQIRWWDSLVVPVSKLLDPLFGFQLGKSIVTVWTRLPSASSGS